MKRVWVFAVAAVACGKSAAKVFEENKVAMAAMLEPVRAKAADLKLVDSDGITGVNEPLTTWLKNGNAVVVSESHLANMHVGGTDSAFVKQKLHDGRELRDIETFGTIGWIHEANWVTGAGTFAPDRDVRDADEARANVERFLGLRYVIVIRILDYKAPKITSSDETSSKFVPGLVVAEARVLDIKGGDHGGFRYSATNSDQITASKGDAEGAFRADFLSNTEKAFDAKLGKLLPKSSSMDEFVLGEKPLYAH
jgi:hypothetical protein